MHSSRPAAISKPSQRSALLFHPTSFPRRSRALAVVLAASMISPCAVRHCAAQPTTDEMLDAIVARGATIFSARIEFEVTSIIKRGEREVVDQSDQYVLTISGDDWILRYDDSPNFTMNFNDSSIRFYQTESEKTGIYRSLQMSAPETIDDALGSSYAFSVARHGTLWYRRQIEFVDRQRHRAKQQPGKPIDGHSTFVFQWRVGEMDLDDAIVVVPQSIRKDLAGYLKLYAAPSLGYALPRIDYVTIDGQLTRRIESSDFIELEDELYFPKFTRLIAYAQGERHITDFKVSKIEYVNQDLPKEEFAVQIPPDTRVRDSRPGTPQAVFHLGNQKGIDAVAQIVEGSDSRSNRFSLRVGCLVANGLLVFLLVVVWVRRQCRSN